MPNKNRTCLRCARDDLVCAHCAWLPLSGSWASSPYTAATMCVMRALGRPPVRMQCRELWLGHRLVTGSLAHTFLPPPHPAARSPSAAWLCEWTRPHATGGDSARLWLAYSPGPTPSRFIRVVRAALPLKIVYTYTSN